MPVGFRSASLYHGEGTVFDRLRTTQTRARVGCNLQVMCRVMRGVTSGETGVVRFQYEPLNGGASGCGTVSVSLAMDRLWMKTERC